MKKCFYSDVTSSEVSNNSEVDEGSRSIIRWFVMQLRFFHASEDAAQNTWPRSVIYHVTAQLPQQQLADRQWFMHQSPHPEQMHETVICANLLTGLPGLHGVVIRKRNTKMDFFSAKSVCSGCKTIITISRWTRTARCLTLVDAQYGELHDRDLPSSLGHRK